MSTFLSSIFPEILYGLSSIAAEPSSKLTVSDEYFTSDLRGFES